MAELVLKYLFDKVKSYNLQYKEDMYPFARQFRYLNNIIVNTSLFDRLFFFCSIKPAIYSLNKQFVPVDCKTLKETGDRSLNSPVSYYTLRNIFINKPTQTSRQINFNTFYNNQDLFGYNLKYARYFKGNKNVILNNTPLDTVINEETTVSSKNIYVNKNYDYDILISRINNVFMHNQGISINRYLNLNREMYCDIFTYKDYSHDLKLNRNINLRQRKNIGAYSDLYGVYIDTTKNIDNNDKYFNNIYNSDSVKKTNIINLTSIFRYSQYISNIFKTLSASKSISSLSKLENKSLSKRENILNINYMRTLNKSVSSNNLNVLNNKVISSIIRKMSYNNSFVSISSNIPGLNLTSQFLDTTRLTSDANINETYNISEKIKYVDYHLPNISSVLSTKNISEEYKKITASGKLNLKDFNIGNDIGSIKNFLEHFSLNKYIEYDKSNNFRNLIYLKAIDIHKISHQFRLFNDLLWLFKYDIANKEISYKQTDRTFNKISKNIFYNDREIEFINKINKLLREDNTLYELYKIPHDMPFANNVFTEILFAEKCKKETNNKKYFIFAHDDKIDFEKSILSDISFHKLDYDLEKYLKGKSVFKKPKDIFSTYDNVPMCKKGLPIGIDLPNIKNIDKKSYDIGLDDNLVIDKYYKNCRINPVNDILLSKREFLIEIAKDIFSSNTDKKSYDMECIGYIISIDDNGRDIGVKDNSVSLYQARDIKVKDDSVSLYQTREIKTDNNGVSVSEVINNANFNDYTVSGGINKSLKIDDTNISLYDTVPNIEKYKDVIPVQEEINAGLQEEIVVSKINPDIYTESELPIVKVSKIYNTDNDLLVDYKKDIDISQYNNYLVNKNSIDTNKKIKEYTAQIKVLKDLHYDYKDKWVYDPTAHDDLDLTAGGVDELLLPSGDYNYESLRPEIINEDTMEPINPIKQLSDGSFIAKMPINHPLKEYKDIAKKYLDIDVNLLRHMISVFNKTWRDNIFKFGAMDMRDAVAKMLEFTEAYIELQIPTPLMEQAYRILRLIRWYGEASIMKNSQYKITYEYGPLNSGLETGECKIPNTMDNMMVDTSGFTITNSVTGRDANIEFEIDNPVDTEILFKTYITNGYIEVFINDISVLHTEDRIYEHNYNLKKIPIGKNKVKVFYHSDFNGIINIAAITINNMVRSNVFTEYYPVIGSGNKILDDFIKNISVYADLYTNNSKFIQDMINGNLAITDLIDRLETYFELHHNKKSKGKRRTIKK